MNKFAAILATTSAVAVSSAVAFDGPHVGATLGMSMYSVKAKNDVKNNANPVAHRVNGKANLSDKAFLGGLTLGWDRVFNNKYLIGAELLGDFTSAKIKAKTNISDAVNNNYYTTEIRARYNLGAALKAGVIFNNALTYLSVGYMGTQFKVNNVITQGQFTGKFPTVKKFLHGVRTAVGVAFMATEQVMVGAELGYTKYGKLKINKEINSGGVLGGTKLNNRSRFNPSAFDGRLKVAYKIKSLSR